MEALEQLPNIGFSSSILNWGDLKIEVKIEDQEESFDEIDFGRTERKIVFVEDGLFKRNLFLIWNSKIRNKKMEVEGGKAEK